MKIKLISKLPESDKVICKATFKLDNEDKDIFRYEPLDVGIHHFKIKYLEPFSQMVCDINCLTRVKTTGIIM